MMKGESVSFTGGATARFEPMKIFRINNISIVPQQMEIHGDTRIISADTETRETGRNAFIFNILSGAGQREISSCGMQDHPFSSGSFLLMAGPLKSLRIRGDNSPLLLTPVLISRTGIRDRTALRVKKAKCLYDRIAGSEKPFTSSGTIS